MNYPAQHREHRQAQQPPGSKAPAARHSPDSFVGSRDRRLVVVFHLVPLSQYHCKTDPRGRYNPVLTGEILPAPSPAPLGLFVPCL